MVKCQVPRKSQAWQRRRASNGRFGLGSASSWAKVDPEVNQSKRADFEWPIERVFHFSQRIACTLQLGELWQTKRFKGLVDFCDNLWRCK